MGASLHAMTRKEHSVWLRLWEAWHGPVVDASAKAAREEALARLAALEAAARQLGVLEDVEEQRERAQ